MKIIIDSTKSIGGYCSKRDFKKMYRIEKDIDKNNFNNEILELIKKYGNNATDFYFTDNSVLTIRYFRDINNQVFNQKDDEKYFNDCIDGIEYEVDFLFDNVITIEQEKYIETEISKIINRNWFTQCLLPV